MSYFDTEGKCVEHFVKWRWNGEPECPDKAIDKMISLLRRLKKLLELRILM